MSDTVKIPRPRFVRNPKGASGRIEHDSKGNAVLVRTRASDTAELAVNTELKVVNDDRTAREGTRGPKLSREFPSKAKQPRR